MDQKRLVIIGAIAAGLVAGYLLLGMNSAPPPAPTKVVKEEPKFARILAAATPIKRGELLNTDNLTWINWPLGNVKPEFIDQAKHPDIVKEMVGRRSMTAISSGVPILQENLSGKGAGFLSTLVSPGNRAMSLTVNLANIVGGFVLPEDHVDIGVVHKDGQSAASGRIVLSDIRVLAINQVTEPPADAKAIDGVANMTVEVSAKDAVGLAAAAANGDLVVTLRNPQDHKSGSENQSDLSGQGAAPVRIINYGISSTLKQ